MFGKFNKLRHGIFTRNHGFSTGDFKSLNTAFSVGDDIAAVQKNRKSIARCIKTDCLEFSNQVHASGIRIFHKTKKQYFMYPNAPGESADNSADAMITDIPGKFLAIMLADCQAVLLYDPYLQVVANIHSGWRGSVQNIVGACISAMTSEFGCRPENLVAAVSPSLGPCCAEFIHFQREIPATYWSFKNTDDHFDFWKITRKQLSDSGVLSENIQLSNICTKCNPHLFFSFRAKKRTGRFVAVIGLK